MTTESDFDDEFNIEEITKKIVEYHKEQLKPILRKKRHKQ